MIENDTLKLLRECDAGVKMGIESIEEVLPSVKASSLEKILTECKEKHEDLVREIQTALVRFGDEGKNPNPMAKGMSWIKTNVMLAVEESDRTVADLMTDGCDMGVKSLSRYLNEYRAADEDSKRICQKLIDLEATLSKDLRAYL